MMADQISYSSGTGAEPGKMPKKKVKINSKADLLKKIKSDAKNWK